MAAQATPLRDFLANSERLLDTLWSIHTGRKTRTQRLVAALEHDGQFESRVEIVQPGMFSHLRRSEAAWVFLLAGIPQTSAQVAAALARGMVKTRAADEYRATQACMTYGREVGRLKRYGLRHWTVNLAPVAARAERKRQQRMLRLVAKNGRRVA